MRRTVLLLLVILTGNSLLPARPDTPRTRKVRLGNVALTPSPTRDFTAPEGRTRWDLTGLSRDESYTRSLEVKDGAVLVEEEHSGPKGAALVRSSWTDPAGGDAALRWWFPDQDPARLRMGSREEIVLDEAKGDESARLHIGVEVVGIGWVHLPSGPREVVLQRVTIRSDRAGSRWDSPAEAGYRWVDPRAGVVAEIRGPAAPGTGALLAPGSATVLDAVIEGAADLKIHVSELYSPVFSDITYGWDTPGTCISTLGACTTTLDCPLYGALNSPQPCVKPISGLTIPSHATMADLLAASSWDFSANTTGAEVASTTTPVNSSETCNFGSCGYATPGAFLERTDKNFNVPAKLYKINDAAQLENRASDVTIWLRAGTQNEGKADLGNGDGENRFCYTTVGGTVRTPVPLWRFIHLDVGSTDYYFQALDSWKGPETGSFNCEPNIWSKNVCGSGGSNYFVKSCTDSGTGTHDGNQRVDVIKGGVVTLPSGHTFNALVARNVADFCVFLFSGCSSLFKVDTVRTANYLWQVPHLGTVVRLQSAQNAPAPPNIDSFSDVVETDIHFGLLPPRSISVTGTTATSVSLSWDPGLDTHRISDYKIYWDTDPGAVSSYAFNSEINPGQASFTGTSATISGLSPGLTYYFTVTSRTIYTDPSTGVPSPYESILYPTQVSGDPSFVYPVEVQASLACPATAEVTGVTVNTTANPGEIQVCWNPVTEACLTGYQILGSSSAASDSGFSVLGTVGITNCWTGSPFDPLPPETGAYLLVVATGMTGNGPWGHYGH